MATFHLNIGHCFAQPYESDYAQWRRCLSVNRGVPFAVIVKQLRAFVPHTTPLLARLRGLQHAPTPTLSYRNPHSYRRQCPRCVAQLYHTDLFALQWINACPLHDCAITTHCPACHAPWPDIKALPKRACPVCGILSAEHLREVSLPAMQQTDYRPIRELYALLAKNDQPHCLLTVDPVRRYPVYWSDSIWWTRLPIENAQYGALLTARSRRFLEHRRRARQIRFLRMTYRASALNPWDGQPLLSIRARHHLECRAVNAVRRWIDAATPAAHRLQFDDYRGLSTADLAHQPIRCAYCTAFSIWLMHLLRAHYGQVHPDRVRYYPFLAAAGFPGMCHLGLPMVMRDNTTYRLDPAFVAWFYQRTLRTAFVQLLAFLQRWYEACPAPPARTDPQGPGIPLHYADFFYADQHVWTETCVTRVCDDRFFFFFAQDDPLQAPDDERLHAPVQAHASLHTARSMRECQRLAGVRQWLSAPGLTAPVYARLLEAVATLLDLPQIPNAALPGRDFKH